MSNVYQLKVQTARDVRIRNKIVSLVDVMVKMICNGSNKK